MSVTENEVARILGYNDADEFISLCESPIKLAKFFQIVNDRLYQKLSFIRQGIQILI